MEDVLRLRLQGAQVRAAQELYPAIAAADSGEEIDSGEQEQDKGGCFGGAGREGAGGREKVAAGDGL